MKKRILVILGLMVLMFTVTCDRDHDQSLKLKNLKRLIWYSVMTDFDNDGKDDMADLLVYEDQYQVVIDPDVKNEEAEFDLVWVLRISRDFMENVTGIGCSDSNGDGNLDLVLKSTKSLDDAGKIQVGTAKVIYGNGDGTFQEQEGLVEKYQDNFTNLKYTENK